MTKQIIISLIAAATVSFQAQAAEYDFIAEDNSATTRLCIAAATDDVAEVRKQVRNLRTAPHIQYKTVVNSVRCNGEVAASFAHTYGAMETFSYLFKYTEKRNKRGIPRTSVEEVVSNAPGKGEQETILIRVRGS